MALVRAKPVLAFVPLVSIVLNQRAASGCPQLLQNFASVSLAVSHAAQTRGPERLGALLSSATRSEREGFGRASRASPSPIRFARSRSI